MARKPGKDSSERITGTVWTGRITSVYTRQRGEMARIWSKDRVAATGQSRQDNCDRTASTGQPGDDSGDRTARTCQPGLVGLESQPGQFRLDRERERTRQQKHDIKDLTARTDHPRETANTGQIYETVRAWQHGQDSGDRKARWQECRDRQPGQDRKDRAAGEDYGIFWIAIKGQQWQASLKVNLCRL
jgi:hypothetical protein